MALEEYRRKRDFKKTPEPPPDQIKARKQQLLYLVQKHDATRLHYDFRLELDGVLLSWAVTKGPSLNPADKRLAVRTEDHPLSYGTFEGTIPKGQYGGGTVMMWDEGTWEPKGHPRAALEKGHLSFVLHGQRLKGGWGLIRMRGDGKRENWLLVKENDKEARPNGANEFLKGLSSSVKTGRAMDEIAEGETPGPNTKITARSGNKLKRLMQRYPEVQLATLVDQPPEGEQWLHEIKFDGYRLLGFVAGGVPRMRTRNGKDWTDRFPSLAAALETLKAKDAVLDMEAVIVDEQGKSSFHALQAALGDGGNESSIVAYVFDLIHLDGRDLTKLPLTERKEKLESLLKKSKQDNWLRYSAHIAGDGAEMFVKACETGLEGIVSKQGRAPYVTGRQKSWLKIKCAQRQEFIILGFSDARKGERALGALYLGYRKNGALRQDGHIRHPSFQGLRDDKDAGDVKQETPVKTVCSRKPPKEKANPDRLVLSGVTITHPDRVISETGHITKGDLAEYYACVAPLILPHIIQRPLSLLRCPSGIDGECFFQRNPGKGLGADVKPFEFEHKGKKYEYFYIEDEKGLLEVIQMGAIELHPWGAPVNAIDYPDRMIFDLDPAPDVPFKAVKLAAQDLRQRLQRKGLEPVLKCTGGKGLHVTVPLAGKDQWPAVKSFAASLAEEMVAATPEAYVATMSKAKRTGRIFIDYFRNDSTATAIADYAVRARPGAPVALPLDWKELKGLKSASQFTMKEVLKRVKNRKPGFLLKQEGQTIS